MKVNIKQLNKNLKQVGLDALERHSKFGQPVVVVNKNRQLVELYKNGKEVIINSNKKYNSQKDDKDYFGLEF